MTAVLDGITRSLEEVWELKQAVYDDIKDMTPDQRKAYFQESLAEAARILGAGIVENPDGTKSFAPKGT